MRFLRGGGVEGAGELVGGAAVSGVVADGGVAGDRDGFAAGVGVTRNGGEGRVRTTGETDGAGVAGWFGTVAEALGTIVAAGELDGARDGLGRGLVVGGRAGIDGEAIADVAGVAVVVPVVAAAGVGVAAAGVALGENLGWGLDATGVGLAAADAVGVAEVADRAGVVAVAAGVGLGADAAETLGLIFGDAAGVVVAVAELVAGAAVGVAEEAVAELSSGFTNVFGGALGGGVDSERIFVRARSAAERSAIVQPLSMFTSTTRSFTRRGRGISRTSVMGGAEISSSSPRTVATLSVFWRRSR
jgi:hypothetical protein